MHARQQEHATRQQDSRRASILSMQIGNVRKQRRHGTLGARHGCCRAAEPLSEARAARTRACRYSEHQPARALCLRSRGVRLGSELANLALENVGVLRRCDARDHLDARAAEGANVRAAPPAALGARVAQPSVAAVEQDGVGGAEAADPAGARVEALFRGALPAFHQLDRAE
eukprot:3964143-Pleurochrysis_carterae.AAC.1